MNDLNPFLIIGFFVFLFSLVGLWQRKVDRNERKRVIEEIKEAKNRGTGKAIAQYPQIAPLTCIGCGSCVKACPEDGVLGLVDGIAHVIHGARCVGHARCEAACPVGAIRVGLGDITQRPDIPVLNDSMETSIPGLFIAGELGGIALIRNAVDQGARVVETIARKQKAGKGAGDSAPDILDLLIVGAGPSGLSASLKATEAGLRFSTIDQEDIGGTIRKYPRRKLTLVQTVTIPLHGRLAGREYEKEELIALWETLIRKHNLPVRTRIQLLSLSKRGETFEAETSAGTIRSRFVILSLGRRGTPRRLGVPGEDLEKVFYQLIDAATYTDRHVLIVGGGDSAVEAATGLADQRGNVVTLSYRKESFFRLKARNEKRINDYAAAGKVRVLFGSAVERIEPENVSLKTSAERMKNAAAPADMNPREDIVSIPNHFVFIFAGGDPPFPLLQKIGIRFGTAPAPAAGR